MVCIADGKLASVQTKASKPFWITFSAVLVALLGILTYYAVNCQEIAKMHSEPQLGIALLLFSWRHIDYHFFLY